MNSPFRVAIALVTSVVLTSGCDKTSCLRGDDGCRIASPCEKLTLACETPEPLEIATIDDKSQRPEGRNALGAVGDIRFANGHLVAVVAGLGTQHYLDPSGGSLIDLEVKGQKNDALNQMVQVTGILPKDA